MSDITYNYWCTHGCYGNKMVPVTKDYEDKDREEPCPNCDKPMKRMGFRNNIFLGSFDSKSPAEKREILSKREREYSKRDKTFHEYKKHMDHETGK